MGAASGAHAGADLIAAHDRNWQVMFTLLAGHAPRGATRTEGGIVGALSGTPVGFFNRIFALDGGDDELRAMAEWADAHAVPYLVVARDDAAGWVRSALAERTLEDADTSPGMAHEDLEALPQPSGEPRVTPVRDDDTLAAFVTVAAAAFGIPRALAEEISPPSVLDEADMEWFVGWTDGRPAACAQIVCTDGVVGLYTVGVDPELRGRGLGGAISAAALRAGLERGCRVGILQSSAMGLPVYERLGFVHLADYRSYAVR